MEFCDPISERALQIINPVKEDWKGGVSVDGKQIIDLYFERNEQAIKETDAKYGAFCHRIAMNILSIHEDAEKCVKM